MKNKVLILLLFIVSFFVNVEAQNQVVIRSGPTKPPSCSAASRLSAWFFKTSNADLQGSVGLYKCVAGSYVGPVELPLSGSTIAFTNDLTFSGSLRNNETPSATSIFSIRKQNYSPSGTTRLLNIESNTQNSTSLVALALSVTRDNSGASAGTPVGISGTVLNNWVGTTSTVNAFSFTAGSNLTGGGAVTTTFNVFTPAFVVSQGNSVGTAKIFYSDSLITGTGSSVTSSLSLFSGRIRNLSSASTTEVRGFDLSGWSNTGTIGTAIGVYIGSDTAVGSTNYAIRSLSTAPSTLAGTLFATQFNVDGTLTGVGTTGNQTINKAAFTVRFAAAATSVVVTNSFVTANTPVQCTVQTNDTTLTSVQAVRASGSVTLFANAAATAETEVFCEVKALS